MAYFGELDTGLTIYLDNRQTETVIAMFTAGHGQLELSHRDLYLGSWISPPEIIQTPTTIIVKLETSAGTHYIEIEGMRVTLLDEVPALGTARRIHVRQVSCVPPLQPIPA
jgi:hypothetical protein